MNHTECVNIARMCAIKDGGAGGVEFDNIASCEWPLYS
jgi:hypothetical protein